MTSLVDAQVGRIMSTLGELGLERDTVVIFTSDHGDMMGDHGMVLKGAMHFGGLTRVPFVWVDPDSGVQAQTMPHPASSLDLLRPCWPDADLPFQWHARLEPVALAAPILASLHLHALA